MYQLLLIATLSTGTTVYDQSILMPNLKGYVYPPYLAVTLSAFATDGSGRDVGATTFLEKATATSGLLIKRSNWVYDTQGIQYDVPLGEYGGEPVLIWCPLTGDWEEFKLWMEINNTTTLRIPDTTLSLRQRWPGDINMQPTDKHNPSIIGDPFTINWRLEGPFSEVSGTHDIAFQSGNQYDTWYYTFPESNMGFPALATGRARQDVLNAWSGTLDGVDFAMIRTADARVVLMPETSALVLVVLGLLGLVLRFRSQEG